MSPEKVPLLLKLLFLSSSGAVQRRSLMEKRRKTLTDKENQRENFYSYYSVCELTLGFLFIHVHTLTNQNVVEAIICHLQHEAAVYHTVPGFEPSVDDITIVQVLHPLTSQFRKCILLQITPRI